MTSTELHRKINAIIENGGGIQDKITNCITEIPQRIKLELNNGTLTLKAGSKLYQPNGKDVFTEIETASDVTRASISVSRQMLLFYDAGINSIRARFLSGIMSGSTAPTSFNNYPTWYDTTNNVINFYEADGTLASSTGCFPICLVTSDSTGAIKSIDQVFNGIGYIGSTIWVDKGVKVLMPNGRNEDGTLKNIEYTFDKVVALETNNDSSRDNKLFMNVNGNGVVTNFFNKPLTECERKDIPSNATGNFFLTDENRMVYVTNGQISSTLNRCVLANKCYVADGIVQNMEVKQPFRAVDYNDFTKAVDNSLNKQQITNCITEIPQRIKLSVVDDGTTTKITLKAGSIVRKPDGGKNTEIIVAQDIVRTVSSSEWVGEGDWLIWTDGYSLLDPVFSANCSSGSSAGTTAHGALWYDTTNKIIKRYSGSSWETTPFDVEAICFPIGEMYVKNGHHRLKQTFNGFGYIGSTFWVDEGVKALFADGKNEDGTYRNIEVVTAEFKLRDYTYNNQDPLKFYIEPWGGILTSGTWQYIEGINPPENFAGDARNWYNPITNLTKYSNDNGATWADCPSLVCFAYGKGALTGKAFADFEITSGTFRALDYNDKRMITYWGYPSRKYDSLTLGANGSSYIAPANGWFAIDYSCKAGGWVMMQHLHSNHYGVVSQNSIAGSIRAMLPVKRGEGMYLTYYNLNTSGTPKNLFFIYAEGDQ